MNVVFDFAGVLFHWQPHELLQRLLPRQAPDQASARSLALHFFEGYAGDWGEFDRGTVAVPELARRIARRTGIALGDVQRVIDAVPAELQPMPAMLALLQRLRERGHRLFFLSNMPAPYADHLEAAHSFVSSFEAGVFSSRVHLIKPEPEIFAHAVKRFGIDARDTLFVDDVLVNAQAAQQAGWQALHFQDPARCEAELVQRGLLQGWASPRTA
jgi:putative hydrolase of the HAD superfamily